MDAGWERPQGQEIRQEPGAAPGSPSTSPATRLPAARPNILDPKTEVQDLTRPRIPRPPEGLKDRYEGRPAVVGPALPVPVDVPADVEKPESTPRPALAGQWPDLPQPRTQQAPALLPERVEHLLTRTHRLRDEQRAV
ncbi:hypothetical protein V1638_05595 [Pseudarthrobacter sp. J64]|uniref:hypothetical protein n=1 Tax=Pseudarthrobacter sp. J64 TaxID=3116485 RepID=UPI002E81DCB9|nr:hypothetical protein [Pseudarthrobacter sp. J64]MEE2568869.1 hypothetical protein [Pseudarthrobacter sp. J64]